MNSHMEMMEEMEDKELDNKINKLICLRKDLLSKLSEVDSKINKANYKK